VGPVWAVVVAAGSGARFGGLKQFERIGGRTILDRSLAAARAAADGVVVVVAAENVADVRGADAVVVGGATRSASVRAGLDAVPAGADVVVVHDAARPLAAPDLWSNVIAAVRNGADAAICAVPVTDTLKRVDGEVVTETVDRDGMVSVQTPQAFKAAVLRRAHAAGGDATDDAGLVEAVGGRVVVVAGSPTNVKITRREDLSIAEALLERAAP
jgi:2-C-methyl-D-erythritol 4-phosphate cytidylyltransferase